MDLTTEKQQKKRKTKVKLEAEPKAQEILSLEKELETEDKAMGLFTTQAEVEDNVYTDDYHDEEEQQDLGERAFSAADITVEQMGNYDVFEYAAKKLNGIGDVPKFTIYKNGEMIATKNYPYSWEKVQEEFGSGQFKVMAKRFSNGKIFKVQTQYIGEDPTKVKAKEEAQSKSNNSLEFLTLLERSKEREESRLRQIQLEAEKKLETMRQEAKENSNNTLALVMKFIDSQGKKDNSSDTLMLLMKMQETVMGVVTKMQESVMQAQAKSEERTQKLIEKMSDETRKLMTESNKKDPWEMVRILDERAEKKLDQWMSMREFAKAEVEEILESKGGGEKESSMDKILGAVGSLLSKGILAPQAAVPYPQAMSVPQQGRSLPQTAPAQNVSHQAEVHEAKETAFNPLNDESNSRGGETAISVKDVVVEVATPILVDAIGNAKDPKDTANVLLNKLLERTITREQALKNFSFEELRQGMASLDSDVRIWFDLFYEEFSGGQKLINNANISPEVTL